MGRCVRGRGWVINRPEHTQLMSTRTHAHTYAYTHTRAHSRLRVHAREKIALLKDEAERKTMFKEELGMADQ